MPRCALNNYVHKKYELVGFGGLQAGAPFINTIDSYKKEEERLQVGVWDVDKHIYCLKR